MDIYQILTTYNHIWSMKEILIALLILAVIIIGSLFLYQKKRIKASQAITIPTLTSFLLIVLGTTVFGRMPGGRSYKLMPFWSYGAIISGDSGILQEVLLNCALLFPAGFLCHLWFIKNDRVSWTYYLNGYFRVHKTLTAHFLQNIIHNRLGCIVGCGISSWLIKQYNKGKV